MRDENGEPLESLASLSGLSQTRPAYAAAIAIFMFSLAGIPPLFGFWPKLLVFNAAVDAGLIALAVAAIVGTVVGAYYYLRIVKIMYFDEDPLSRWRASRQPVEGAVDPRRGTDRLAARLSADRPARPPRRPRRGVALLSRIRIVERTGSTNADLLASKTRRPRATGWSRGPGSGAGAAGTRMASRSRAISLAARWSCCARTIRRRRPCRWPRGWR